jgi:hypothetical protein
VGLFLELEARDAAALGSEVGGKPNAVEALVPLVEIGIVVRGRSIRCRECNYPSFLSLAVLDKRVACPACQASFVLPVALPNGRQEPPIQYRLDGLMARIMDQDTLPVLLAIRAFRTLLGSPELFFAWPGIQFADHGQRVDVDLIVSTTQTAFCCEVKLNAAGLAQEQLERLLRVVDKLQVRPAIVAPNGEFTPEQLELVTERQGMALTRSQLLASHQSSVTPSSSNRPLLDPERISHQQQLTGRVQLAAINIEGGEGAAAYEWQFEIDAECKDDVGACPIQALARQLVSGSGPGQAFQRQLGARPALNRQRRNDQGEGFGRLARGSSRGGRGACS